MHGATLDTCSPDLRPGKTSLINVWATWCGPYPAEHPHLQKSDVSGKRRAGGPRRHNERISISLRRKIPLQRKTYVVSRSGEIGFTCHACNWIKRAKLDSGATVNGPSGFR
jgi:hypothetical protein